MLEKNITGVRTRRSEVGPALALAAVLALIAVVLIALLTSTAIISAAATNTVNGLGFNVIVAGVCTPVLSNTLISFGTVKAGFFAATANAEKVSDVGSVSSNIVLYSTSTTTGNWVSGTLSFLTGNTLWDAQTRAANNGNQLTNTITTDTQVLVTVGGSSNLFFGLNVPSGQAAATYTQGITVSLSC